MEKKIIRTATALTIFVTTILPINVKAMLPWQIEKEWHDATTEAHACYRSHWPKIKPEDCPNCKKLNARESRAAAAMDRLSKEREGKK